MVRVVTWERAPVPRHAAVIGALALAVGTSGGLVVVREHLDARPASRGGDAIGPAATSVPSARRPPPGATASGRRMLAAAAGPPAVAAAANGGPGPRTSTPSTTGAQRALGPARPAPGAAQPPTARQPAEGTYGYVEDVNGGSDQAASLTVYDDGSTTTSTLADDDGQHTEEATWSAAARTLVATTADGQRCAWSPATVALPLPLTTGQTWSTTSQCTVHIGHGATATVDETEDSAVKGWAIVRIGADDVAVWAITRHTTLTETTTTKAGTDTAYAESQRTELFAPALGIDVQVTEQSVAPDQHGTSRRTYSILRLTSTQPQ